MKFVATIRGGRKKKEKGKNGARGKAVSTRFPTGTINFTSGLAVFLFYAVII